jgi:hypothetical protein
MSQAQAAVIDEHAFGEVGFLQALDVAEHPSFLTVGKHSQKELRKLRRQWTRMYELTTGEVLKFLRG